LPAKSTVAYRAEKLSATFDRKAFDCGHPRLNDYLWKFALQNQERSIATTYVAVPDGRATTIAGFYAVCTSQLEFQNLPPSMTKGMPRYPVPAMRLAQLAVDKRFTGQGLGEYLVGSALRKAVSISNEVGLVIMIVDAIDEKAATFYEHIGFLRLPHTPQTLCFPLSALE
jgi:GNAT superfamily N-acetyltransferase